MAEESYSESAITATGFKAKTILYKIKLGNNYTGTPYICSKGSLNKWKFRVAIIYDMVSVSPEKLNLCLTGCKSGKYPNSAVFIIFGRSYFL